MIHRVVERKVLDGIESAAQSRSSIEETNENLRRQVFTGPKGAAASYLSYAAIEINLNKNPINMAVLGFCRLLGKVAGLTDAQIRDAENVGKGQVLNTKAIEAIRRRDKFH